MKDRGRDWLRSDEAITGVARDFASNLGADGVADKIDYFEDGIDDSLSSIYQTIKDNLTGNGQYSSFGENFDIRRTARNDVEGFRDENYLLVDKINNATDLSAEGNRQLVDIVSGVYQSGHGNESELDIYLINNDGANNQNYLGFYDNNGNAIYINTDNLDISNPGQYANIIFHENKHVLDSANGISYNEAQEHMTGYYGDSVGSIWDHDNRQQGFHTGGYFGNTIDDWRQGNNDSYVYELGNRNSSLVSIVNTEPKTIFLHGTNSSVEEADPEFIEVLKETFGEDPIQISWSGENTVEARKAAAEYINDYLSEYDYFEGEELHFVSHSHAGNVFKELSQLYTGDKLFDTVVFLGTPHRYDHQLNWNVVDSNANLINLYDRQDLVQIMGHSDGNNLFFAGLAAPFAMPYANRTIDNFNNVEIYQTYDTVARSYKDGYSYISSSGIGPILSHYMLDSAEVWNKNIRPLIEINE